LRLRLTRRAVADLDRAKRWYTQAGSGQVAARRLASIGAAINDLAVSPLIGRLDTQQGVRRLARQGHVIIYKVSPLEIVIVRILGPGQQS